LFLKLIVESKDKPVKCLFRLPNQPPVLSGVTPWLPVAADYNQVKVEAESEELAGIK
jgi:hypothetical protein